MDWEAPPPPIVGTTVVAPAAVAVAVVTTVTFHTSIQCSCLFVNCLRSIVSLKHSKFRIFQGLVN